MRILIVEDEKRVAQFLQKGFPAESFTVDVANDGLKACACPTETTTPSSSM